MVVVMATMAFTRIIHHDRGGAVVVVVVVMALKAFTRIIQHNRGSSSSSSSRSGSGSSVGVNGIYQNYPA